MLGLCAQIYRTTADRRTKFRPRHEIVARQLFALKQHYSGKLRLTDIKELFEQMKDFV